MLDIRLASPAQLCSDYFKAGLEPRSEKFQICHCKTTAAFVESCAPASHNLQYLWQL